MTAADGPPVPDAEARERFLAVALHKLKTPLAVVAGWSATLRQWDALSDDERAAGLDAIERAAAELQAQVADVLAEARADLLTRSLELRTVELGPFLDERVAAVAERGEPHQITVSVPAGVAVRADPEALRRVIDHLLDNATRYSPGGGAVELFGAEVDDHVALRITDHGIGLPDDLDVFQPFQRGRAASELARGTGLGLHVVRSLLAAMEGEIIAVPTEVGAVFELRLPRG